jgi:hypothetical protein
VSPRKGRRRAAEFLLIGAAALFVWPSFGCVGETEEHPLDKPLAATCIDKDGDGYGEGCDAGPDCNDDDAEHHDDCPQVFAKKKAMTECVEGDVEECKVILGTHNGVTDCFVGVHKCVEGAWSNCGSPS